jgi:hypothetical protein
MAKVSGTRATHSFTNGHWNWFPDCPETCTEILVHLEGYAPRPAVTRIGERLDKSHSEHEKATRGMNFSAVELNALIHDLKQLLWQMRRMDRSRMTNDHSLNSKSGGQ